jgi:hypothetical protein
MEAQQVPLSIAVRTAEQQRKSKSEQKQRSQRPAHCGFVGQNLNRAHRKHSLDQVQVVQQRGQRLGIEVH